MNSATLTSTLVAARHDPARLGALVAEAAHRQDPEYLADVVLRLVSMIHSAGHNSVEVDMMLDVFAAFPTADDTVPNVGIVRATEPRTPADLDHLFASLTKGTNPADRVWSYRVITGPLPVHAVVLEGTGFTPRHLVVLGGTAQDAESIRASMIARDQ